MTELTLLSQALIPSKAEIERGANELLSLNDILSEKNLALTEAEAHDIAETRITSLRQNSRIEIGIGAAGRILKKFSVSAYITKQNLPELINFLCEIFYFVKTETRDSISDAELVETLFEKFENECAGSTEHLADECEKLIRRYNFGSPKIDDTEENEYAD